MYVKLMQTEAKNLFNQTHQKTGDQARALAYSVLCYSRHVDNIAALAPLVPTIVHKHVALEVLPRHYPIVGGCLLAAIREVLGEEVANDEVIEAWGAAYGVLADALINAERNLMTDLATAPGGWEGTRKFRLASKTPANIEGNVTSYEFVPEDGKEVLRYAPGQYTTIVLDKLAGTDCVTRRNYSLSRPSDGKSLRITVKHLDGGLVSGYLQNKVKVGDVLDFAVPVGEFTLPTAAPAAASGCPAAAAAAAGSKCPITGAAAADPRGLLLLTAGVGITPTLAMLQTATATGAPARKVVFGHYTHNARTFALASEVEAIAQANKNVTLFTSYTRPDTADSSSGLRAADTTGRISQDHIAHLVAAAGGAGNVDVYMLGPKGFMHSARGFFRNAGVPDAAVKYEFFGPFDPSV